MYIIVNELYISFIFRHHNQRNDLQFLDGGKVRYNKRSNSHLDVSTRELKASLSGSNLSRFEIIQRITQEFRAHQSVSEFVERAYY